MDDVLLSAMTTLFFAVWIQLIILTMYFQFRQKGEIGHIIRNWKVTSAVSATSLLGSGLKFTAFTMVNAAYVNAVQQVEMIFALLASYFFFNEKISIREFWGMVIFGVSIIGLVLLG